MCRSNGIMVKNVAGRRVGMPYEPFRCAEAGFDDPQVTDLKDLIPNPSASGVPPRAETVRIQRGAVACSRSSSRSVFHHQWLTADIKKRGDKVKHLKCPKPPRRVELFPQPIPNEGEVAGLVSGTRGTVLRGDDPAEGSNRR